MKKNSGFGLIEVLVSLLLISISVAGIVGLQKEMRIKSAAAEDRLKAMRYIQEAVDDLRAYTNDADYQDRVSAGRVSQNLTSLTGLNFTDFTRNINVNLGGKNFTGMNKDLATIDINLGWQDLRGNDMSARLSTFISPLGTYTSDGFSDLIKEAEKVAELPTEMDPSDVEHVPPEYDSNERYTPGEFVSKTIDDKGTLQKSDDDVEIYRCSSTYCMNPNNQPGGPQGWELTRMKYGY